MLEGLRETRSCEVVIWERIWARAASQSVVVGVLVTRARRAVVLGERAGKVGGVNVVGVRVVDVEDAGAGRNVESVDGGGPVLWAVANAGAGAEAS